MGIENGPIKQTEAVETEKGQVDKTIIDTVRALIMSGTIKGNTKTGEEYPQEGQFEVTKILQELEDSDDLQEIVIDKQGTKLTDTNGTLVRVKKDKLGVRLFVSKEYDPKERNSAKEKMSEKV